jgi:hypothetical protein
MQVAAETTMDPQDAKKREWEEPDEELDTLVRRVIGAAIEVHRRPPRTGIREISHGGTGIEGSRRPAASGLLNLVQGP